MGILHTGDWHVGRLIRGRSRAVEHVAVLTEMAVLAAAERVDLVLVAGDLFDTAAPSAESERIVYRALLDLAASGATVVVISGNHDNERRLQAIEPLLDLGRVVVCPMIARPDSGGVITVHSRDRNEVAQVACLPFLSQRNVVKADDLMGTAGADQQLLYGQRLRSVVGALTAGFDGSTIGVVLAHCMVRGAETVGSERMGQTVFEYSVDATAFPASAHYVALGHLHRQQQVAGPAPTWYSGSPLQLDFGETADIKGVLLVDAAVGRPASVTPTALSGGRRLRVLEGSLAQLGSAQIGDEWIKVRVDEPSRPGLADEVRAIVPDAVDVEVLRNASGTNRVATEARVGRSPHELFSEYLTDRNIVDPRLGALFGELVELCSDGRSSPTSAGTTETST
jgi:exonuclease SbcD